MYIVCVHGCNKVIFKILLIVTDLKDAFSKIKKVCGVKYFEGIVHIDPLKRMEQEILDSIKDRVFDSLYERILNKLTYDGFAFSEYDGFDIPVKKQFFKQVYGLGFNDPYANDDSCPYFTLSFINMESHWNKVQSNISLIKSRGEEITDQDKKELSDANNQTFNVAKMIDRFQEDWNF